jgi:putative membrane protein
MTGKIAFALFVAVVSTGAVAQSMGEKTGVNSALGVAPETADFVTEAAVSDMTEIAAAKIALQKGMQTKGSLPTRWCAATLRPARS